MFLFDLERSSRSEMSNDSPFFAVRGAFRERWCLFTREPWFILITAHGDKQRVARQGTPCDKLRTQLLWMHASCNSMAVRASCFRGEIWADTPPVFILLNVWTSCLYFAYFPPCLLVLHGYRTWFFFNIYILLFMHEQHAGLLHVNRSLGILIGVRGSKVLKTRSPLPPAHGTHTHTHTHSNA